MTLVELTSLKIGDWIEYGYCSPNNIVTLFEIIEIKEQFIITRAVADHFRGTVHRISRTEFKLGKLIHLTDAVHAISKKRRASILMDMI